MRKTLLFLSSLLILLAGCSQNEMDQDQNPIPTQSSKIRWYGTGLPEGTQTRGTADGSKRWNQDAGIYIKFINSPSNQTIIDRVKQTAIEWEEYAGIKFHFVEQDKKADVRIAFNWNNNDWLTWSYTGNDAKSIIDQNQPTAVFGGIEYLDNKEFKGDVLRLFGQILGMEYEQRHQQWSNSGYWKDISQLQAYWEDQFEGYTLDWNQIRQYVFEPLIEQNANQLMQTDEIDELSVMAWPYYNHKQTTKLLANYKLSEGDKAFIAQLYPKSEVSLPTIQEAWVDAGYFIWTDGSKTAVRITDLGRKQEYLPDVSDGEQLTSAMYMFYGSKIRTIPKFNTSSITYFTFMFYDCSSLTTVPLLDTSNGIDFSGMFYNCSSLATVPLFDTANGTEFNMMLGACSSLTTVPLFDTAKGINFARMFNSCSSLTTVPLLNTSKGANFDGMFSGCSSLTTIPLFDTANGISFGEMLGACSSLTTVPLLNTSNGTYFRAMLSGCSSLTAVPLLNTSKGANFSVMFSDCSSLTAIPLLDTSKGIDFSGMLGACSSLTTVPLLNTSNGTSFDLMFRSCASLATVPLFDTAKGINFSGMFIDCSSLTTIPLLDTSNGIDFSRMFAACSSLTTVPLLNTSNGTDFYSMFLNCENLTTKPQLDLSKATNIADMYKGTPFE